MNDYKKYFILIFNDVVNGILLLLVSSIVIKIDGYLNDAY